MEGIEVVQVIHGRRDIPAHFRKPPRGLRQIEGISEHFFIETTISALKSNNSLI